MIRVIRVIRVIFTPSKKSGRRRRNMNEPFLAIGPKMTRMTRMTRIALEALVKKATSPMGAPLRTI